jgi:short subunit dehydrogenase-like uncharacterized protein
MSANSDSAPGAPVPFLIYGANGYTGKLIARAAVQRGLRPVLAGRNRTEVAALAEELALPHCIFGLDEPAVLEAELADVPVVLNCAGPFVHTHRPLVDTCLRTGTHYLDITGELAVFQAIAARDAEAKAAGVMLLPGAGFDVAPSDCLAAHLKKRLPSATRLTLALQPVGGWSRGTARTMVESLHTPGMIRQDGDLTPVPGLWKTLWIDFGQQFMGKGWRGPVAAVAIPWGDVFTAYYSTGIPNIETYLAVPDAIAWMGGVVRLSGPMLQWPLIKAALRRAVESLPEGPDEAALATGFSVIWGEVTDDTGRRAVARLRTPHTYLLTALAALAIVERVLAGNVRPGYQTPAAAYGPNLLLGIEGISRVDE